MNKTFFNRTKELDFLQQKYNSQQPELLIFRGRRRIGKTFLLKEFLRGVNGLYLLATVTSSRDQLLNFSRTMSRFFDDPLLEKRALADWDEFFIYLNRNIQKRTAVILDEYPYLLESHPGLGTILQKYWDEYFRTNPYIFLVLTGSALSMMERETLNGKSPLYGRRTGQWFVSPFDPVENSRFFPKASFIRSIEWYAISGGVPFYSHIFSRYPTPQKAIEQAVLTYGEALFEEVEFLLRGEFRNPRSYFPILKAIAQGSRKFGEISSKTGYDRSNLTKYLATLESLKLIRREIPVTETNPAKSKKGLFYLNDYFMNFWFHYVFPNLTDLESGKTRTVMEKVISPTFDHYVSRICEPIFRQLLQMDFFNLGFQFEKIGRYWDRQVEIDIWGYTTDNQTLIGEIKWTNSPIGEKVFQQLEQKIAKTRQYQRGAVKKLIISKSGVKKEAAAQHPDIICLDLREYQVE